MHFDPSIPLLIIYFKSVIMTLCKDSARNMYTRVVFNNKWNIGNNVNIQTFY